jgi:hypothetical protein
MEDISHAIVQPEGQISDSRLGDNLSNKTSVTRPILVVILIIIVIFILGAIGYLVYQNVLIKSQNASLTIVPTLNPSPRPTSAVNLFTGWKTYTNTSSHYQVQYPPDWRIENQAAGSFGNEPLSNSTFIEIFKPLSDPTTSLGNIGFEELGMIPPSEETLLVTSKHIGNLTARCNNTFASNTKTWCYIQVPDTNKYVNIHVFKNTDEEQNRVLDQILSTFTFLDSTNTSIPQPISDLFTAINQNFNMHQVPTMEHQFYSPTGMISKNSWKLDLLHTPAATKGFITFIRTKLSPNDSESAGIGGGGIDAYENDQMKCFHNYLSTGDNQINYFSCAEK